MRFAVRIVYLVILIALVTVLYYLQDEGTPVEQVDPRVKKDEGVLHMDLDSVAYIPKSFPRKTYNTEGLQQIFDYVDVMVCSDKKTLGGMVAVVNSVLTHATIPVYFHILTDPGEMEHVAEWLMSFKPNIIMEIIPFTKEDLNMQENLKVRSKTRKELQSPLNFARFLIPDILPDVTGRLVYLDDDTIIQGDVKEMRDVHFKEGDVISAAADHRNTMSNFLNFKNPIVKSLDHIKEKDVAFNAGVFVGHIGLWRKNDITRKLLFWLQKNQEQNIYGGGIAGGASQPPMLLALNGLVSRLPPEWHLRHFGWWYGNQKYTKEKVTRAKLLHWNGKWKPWKVGKYGKFNHLWYKYFVPDPRKEFIPIDIKITPPKSVLD